MRHKTYFSKIYRHYYQRVLHAPSLIIKFGYQQFISQMFTIKLATNFAKRLNYRPSFCIIAQLFKKKSNPKPSSSNPPTQNQNDVAKKQEQKQMEDDVYDYFQRRKEVDTSFDFSKLKSVSGQTIPENLGKGGFQQVIYWSQLAKTPQKILLVIEAFISIAEKSKKSPQVMNSGQVHLDDFKGKVISTVYLANSLSTLQRYSRFAYHYQLQAPEFWQKIEFRCIKIFPESKEDQSLLIDIGFMMARYHVGSNIYNHISKLLVNTELTIDQYVKLYLAFYMLKIGEKEWIDKLLKGIDSNMQNADQEQLIAVLQPLKQAKKLPQTMNISIQKRVKQLIQTFSVDDLLKVVGYFGFELENDDTWQLIQAKLNKLLTGKSIKPILMENLILRAMNSYRLSADFIRNYIIKRLEQNNLKQLEDMKLLTLSALSKGLFIYQLEGETKHFQQQISKLIISKVTNDINEITDADLVKVIQDFNLTRNGNRQLYIFFQQVIRIKYLRGYGNEVNRHTIQLLIQIYRNSGMCSSQMYQQLQSLILQ